MWEEQVTNPRDRGRLRCFHRKGDNHPSHPTLGHPNRGKCPKNRWKGSPAAGVKGTSLDVMFDGDPQQLGFFSLMSSHTCRNTGETS